MLKFFVLIATVCLVVGQANGLCWSGEEGPLCDILNLLLGILSSIWYKNPECRVAQYRRDSDPTCSTLISTHVITAPNPIIYGPPGIHWVPIASKYYMARMALALGQRSADGDHLCPGDSSQWNQMDLGTPWTGVDSGIAGRGQAYDWGYAYKKIIRRDCPFPDPNFPASGYPYLCNGEPGSPGTYGDSLGDLSYMPVATDDENWTLFVNCWDPDRPGHTGTNYARSWMVFSKTKTLSPTHLQLIRDKVAAMGFDPASEFLNTYKYPGLGTCGPFDFTEVP
jgi:hypothetical protein